MAAPSGVAFFYARWPQQTTPATYNYIPRQITRPRYHRPADDH